ncbi:type II 3-dehydroquinate dehydratase [Streptomyces sp. NPDC001520]|uniref:type II 3-dehydroquinate dehydratase n=1 Tax=Streptomyces sp. NPDC001520 TaxID=3364581 RepID=UPI0036C0C087
MMRAAVLHGPNLNRLGKRRPDKYGQTTLADIERDIDDTAARLGIAAEHFQSNHEGSLIDWLHERQDGLDLIVVNPAGLTPYGYSLLDALNDTGLPIGVVHISPFGAMDGRTRQDIFAASATVYASGMGWRGYSHALEALSTKIKGI